MGYIVAGDNLTLASGVGGIQAQVLRFFIRCLRTAYHDLVQRFLQKLYIVRVGPRQDYGQGKAMFIRQNAAFCPHFFPGRWGLAQLRSGPAALLPCSRPHFAIPIQSPSVHRIPLTPLPRSSEKNQPLPTPESTDECCSLNHIPRGPLSIDTRSSKHKISLTTPFVGPAVFVPDRPCSDTAFEGLDPVSVVSHFYFLPKFVR